MNNWNNSLILNSNDVISYNFLSKKLLLNNVYSSILDKYTLLLISPYNCINSTQLFFNTSYFLFFEFWDKQIIYNFFFNKLSTVSSFNKYINITNFSSQKYIFNSFMAKSSFFKINAKIMYYTNKLEILDFLSKFSKKYNFCIITLYELYNKIFRLNFFLTGTLNISINNCFLILKTVFIEYKKINVYYYNTVLLYHNNFFSQSTIINNYNSKFFLNSFKLFSKNKFSVNFLFILNFLRVQRRYNKRRYAKSRLYSRPSFFAGVCLSSVIISSFWGGTIKSVDWLTVIPVVVNINYILYILLFFFFLRFIKFNLDIVYLNGSNKFKIYHFLNILFFRKLFKNII